MPADNDGSIQGLCICCLVEGKHRQGGAYIEMFRKCLNLIVAPGSQMAVPMCSACISFVNEVQRFRERVLVAQRRLHGSVNADFIDVPIEDISQDDTETTEQEMKIIKIEIDEETLEPQLAWSENPSPDTIVDEIKLKDENEIRRSKSELKREDIKFDLKIEDAETKDVVKIKDTKNRRETKDIQSIKGKRKESRKAYKSRLKRNRKFSDSESDTPISQVKENHSQEKKDIVKKKPKPTLSQSELLKLRYTMKENNLIRSNIMLLLNHSTITPFRNNFKSLFKCFYCEKSYIPFKELKEHTKTEHTNICEVKVRNVLRKLPEYLVTADISGLKCKICDEEFNSIENLLEHLSKVHEKVYNDTEKKPSHGIIAFDLSNDLKCHLCEKYFPFFKNLLVHMNEHGSFICYICGKKFFSERKYRSHVNKHEKTGATPCKQCGKMFVSKYAMAFHNRKEHIKSKIKCLKCPETFDFERYAQRLEHMEKVHGLKRPTFKCETCGKEFKTSGILSTHINLTHKRSKEYRCDLCSYASFNSSHFKNHVNTHIGERNHECEICKKKFLKMYSLTRHMMVHLNDKRFKCPLCDATFVQKANMKSHVRHRHKDFDISKL